MWSLLIIPTQAAVFPADAIPPSHISSQASRGLSDSMVGDAYIEQQQKIAKSPMKGHRTSGVWVENK